MEQSRFRTRPLMGRPREIGATPFRPNLTMGETATSRQTRCDGFRRMTATRCCRMVR
jgi:hypothetical protein